MPRIAKTTDPNAVDLTELVDRYRLTPRRIAQITGRPPSTVRRWLKQNQSTPEARRLLEIEAAGRLPSTCTSWRGWTIHGRWLVDNEGKCYEAVEIKARWLVWQMVAAGRAPQEPVQLRLF